LSTEETFSSNLNTLEECAERLPELFEEMITDVKAKEVDREITKIFVKLKFSDFTRTTVERAGRQPVLDEFRGLLEEGWSRTGKPVRLLGVGVRFATSDETNAAQLTLL
ncbi:MAG: DNA polymerase IV, partial [Chthoniobacterales bacterium]